MSSVVLFLFVFSIIKSSKKMWLFGFLTLQPHYNEVQLHFGRLRSDILRSQQTLVKSKEGFVDFKDVIVSVAYEILNNYVKLI